MITVPQNAIAQMVQNHKFEYNVFVNMQDFASNLDDMVHIEVEYVTPILVSSSATTPLNYQLPLELLVDLPQQYSYETRDRSCTYHLALLERDNGVMQTAAFTNVAALAKDNTQRQLWSFKQKPTQMTMRPEVLSQKQWRFGFKFIEGTDLLDSGNSFAYMMEIQNSIVYHQVNIKSFKPHCNSSLVEAQRISFRPQRSLLVS